MDKNTKRYLAIIAILVVVYNVLVFLIPFPHEDNATYWLGYAFGLVAILSQVYVGYLGLYKKENIKSMFYGFPIVKLGVFYLLAQLGVSVIFFVINAFVSVPYWIILIISILLIGAFGIGLITTKTYQEEIEKLENNEPLTTKFISDLRIETKILCDQYQGSAYSVNLEKLYEEVRYSDPKSNDQTESIEDEINKKFIEIKAALADSQINVNEMIGKLINLIKERNYRVKLGKK